MTAVKDLHRKILTTKEGSLGVIGIWIYAAIDFASPPRALFLGAKFSTRGQVIFMLVKL